MYQLYQMHKVPKCTCQGDFSPAQERCFDDLIVST